MRLWRVMMGSRFLDAQTAKQAHIRSLYFFIVFLMMATMGLWSGWKAAPEYIRISIPPDLRAGAIVRPDEFQAAQVFAFARMYQLALNRWEEDGAVDFGNRVEELQAYLTPAYQEQLGVVMAAKMARGELKGRTRYAIPLDAYNEYRAEYVETLDNGSWIVHIEMEIVEKVAGLEAKRVKIHYPLSVARISINPVKNIWGLALNGIADGHAEYRVESIE